VLLWYLTRNKGKDELMIALFFSLFTIYSCSISHQEVRLRLGVAISWSHRDPVPFFPPFLPSFLHSLPVVSRPPSTLSSTRKENERGDLSLTDRGGRGKKRACYIPYLFRSPTIPAVHIHRPDCSSTYILPISTSIDVILRTHPTGGGLAREIPSKVPRFLFLPGLRPASESGSRALILPLDSFVKRDSKVLFVELFSLESLSRRRLDLMLSDQRRSSPFPR
jgi:hypothetical protein